MKIKSIMHVKCMPDLASITYKQKSQKPKKNKKFSKNWKRIMTSEGATELGDSKMAEKVAPDDKAELETVLAFLRKKGLRGTETLLQQEITTGGASASSTSTPAASSTPSGKS